MLKFISVLLYQASLMSFIAYYSTNRFQNIYLKDLYYLFLTARPVIIAVYTTLNTICNIKASSYITRTLRKQKLELKEQNKLIKKKTIATTT